MLITKPDYFDHFQCIAGQCPDSCCKEWDVQVDEASASYYRSLSGDLGDRLREVLHTEGDETVMTITDGRCPMWRNDGLCRIQAELGEAALCKTCREFPRLTHDYGDFLELQLELSCPEAAKYILSPERPLDFTVETDDRREAEYDEDAMALLKASRKTALNLLFNTSRTVPETLALTLLYGYQIQGQLLHSPSPSLWTDHYRALAGYLVRRYWLQAVSDYDLYCRVKFIVIACLLVKNLGGDIFRTAQLFSKEIENSIDNVEAILDAAYSHPAFTDDKLIGMLLEHKPV